MTTSVLRRTRRGGHSAPPFACIVTAPVVGFIYIFGFGVRGPSIPAPPPPSAADSAEHPDDLHRVVQLLLRRFRPPAPERHLTRGIHDPMAPGPE